MERLLKPLLKTYDAGDLELSLKAGAALIAIAMAGLVLAVTFVYCGFIHGFNTHRSYIIVLGALFMTAGLKLLVRGRYTLAVHTFFITGFLCLWTVIFMAPNHPLLPKMDTIVLVMLLMSALPLLLYRSWTVMGIYFLANLTALLLFTLHVHVSRVLTAGEVAEYFYDNGLAMVLGFIISIYVFRIHRHILDSLESELAERRIVQAALEESETRLSNHLNHTPVGAVSMDSYLHIREWNPAAEKIFGFTRQEAVGRRLPDLILPQEEKARALEKIEQLLKSEGGRRIENVSLTKDGRRIICDWYNTAIRSRDGRITGVASLVNDITHQRRTEDSLRLTQFAFDKAAVGIFHVTSDGRILNVNEQAAKKLGYTMTELSGMRVFELSPLGTQENFARMWQALVAKRHHTFETEHRDKRGRTFPVQVVSNLIEYGNEHFALAFVHDISQQKQDEEKRAELEARLMQTEKMKAIGTLAGGIAHDFNNILSGIFGYCQLALNHASTPEKTAGYIEQVFKGARRASDLTKQILTFSRQSEYQKYPFQIYLEIKETLQLLRSSIPATIAISTRIHSKNKVLADPIKLHQLTMNLCTNAYHAMRKTGGELTVSLTDMTSADPGFPKDRQIPHGDYVKFEVSDTGHGMDEKTLERAFDPYFTTKEKGNGTGLGLAIVQAIVEEHDGFIDVSSTVGQGTRFSVYLPIVRENPDVSASGPAQAAPLTGDERIMVVDDEHSVRESCCGILEEAGYRVAGFRNGAEALEAFRTDPRKFDLILTDMTMPDLTGDRLSAEVLRLRPDMPIILCTGFTEAITRAEAMDLGIDEFIQKPIQSRDLLGLIRKSLTPN